MRAEAGHLAFVIDSCPANDPAIVVGRIVPGWPVSVFFRVMRRDYQPVSVFGPVGAGEGLAVTGLIRELSSAASPDRRGG
jgi:hypothetical protein